MLCCTYMLYTCRHVCTCIHTCMYIYHLNSHVVSRLCWYIHTCTCGTVTCISETCYIVQLQASTESLTIINILPCCRCDNTSGHTLYARPESDIRPLDECAMECVAGNTSYPCGGLHKHLLFRTDGTLFEAWNTTQQSTGHCAMLNALTGHWHMANCNAAANYVCVYPGNETF